MFFNWIRSSGSKRTRSEPLKFCSLSRSELLSETGYTDDTVTPNWWHMCFSRLFFCNFCTAALANKFMATNAIIIGLVIMAEFFDISSRCLYWMVAAQNRYALVDWNRKFYLFKALSYIKNSMASLIFLPCSFILAQRVLSFHLNSIRQYHALVYKIYL